MERKIKCRCRKCYSVILSLILLLMLCSFQAYASGPINIDADVSMSLHYTGERGPVRNASFQVYHVADVNEYGEYMVTDAFKDYPIAFDGLTQDGWKQLATTLKGYVWKDKIPKFDSGKTDQEGVLEFPSEGVSMKPGLYLVLGSTREIGSYTYYATPFLICLPGMEEDGNQSMYHVDAAPKYRWDYEPSEKSDKSGSRVIGLSRKVLKVWNDSGNENVRPGAITVQLFKDGEVYDTVRLNVENNWRYTWHELEEGHDWTVVEEAVDGYTVNIAQEGITFVVTNTYASEQPTNPNNPDTPGTSGTDWPDKPEDMTWEEYDDWLVDLGLMAPPGGLLYLPQTGQLWWPVPVLVCLGLVCMMIGVLRRRSAYEED